jgi:hypothetical protein
MPAFEEKFAPPNPFASVPTPWREDVTAPAHPYPNWKPTARGDAGALSPYVDDDLREEPSNPVTTGISAVDKAHLTADAIINGGTELSELGHEATSLFTGEASATTKAFAGATAVAAPLSIFGGILDIAEGVGEVRHGNTNDGSIHLVGGGSNIISGASGLAGLGGSSAAVACSGGAAAFGLGLAAGHYGDQQVKKLGWLHDDDGQAVNASQWAANAGGRADDWFTEHGHPSLGTAAGVATTIGASVPGAVMAVGAGAASAGHAAGTAMANHHRASHYANYEGMNIVGGAQGLADYDDDHAAALERSKAEHPERWGNNPHNPTYGQAYAQLLGQVNNVTGGTNR